MGCLLQMGKGSIDLVQGHVDFRLDREDTVELIAEWDERWSPALQKLLEDKDGMYAALAEIKKRVYALDSTIKKAYGVRAVKKDGKDLPKGRRLIQALFRIHTDRSGFPRGGGGCGQERPGCVVPPDGLAAWALAG